MTSDDFPKEGDIAYFVRLHLDTARDVGKPPIKKTGNIRIYEIEGKARPMLVLRCYSAGNEGLREFLLLPMFTKPRLDTERIKDCIRMGVDSYVLRIPERLPENLLSRMKGASPIVAPVNPLAFANVVKRIEQDVHRQYRPRH